MSTNTATVRALCQWGSFHLTSSASTNINSIADAVGQSMAGSLDLGIQSKSTHTSYSLRRNLYLSKTSLFPVGLTSTLQSMQTTSLLREGVFINFSRVGDLQHICEHVNDKYRKFYLQLFNFGLRHKLKMI